MISTSTGCFRGDAGALTSADAAAQVKTAGFDAVELARDMDLTEAGARAFREAGLTIWAVHGSLWMNAVSRDRPVREQALAAELDLMERMASCAPCPYVVHYLDRFEDSGITALFKEAIARLEARAAVLGFILAVETAPHKPDKYPHYPDTAELAAFVQSFNSRHVRVCMDVNHANNNEDLVRAIRNCGSLITTIHVSDNHGACEEHLLPGEGCIDFEAAFRALRDGGYRGAVNLEVRAADASVPEWLGSLAAWAREIEIRHSAGRE